MADFLSKEDRSILMGKVRRSGTSPELAVRRLTRRLGYGYRLRRRDLPGRPDLVFPGKRAVIFVHGCFWHRHEGCRKASMPSSNVEFWFAKLEANKLRDRSVVKELGESGWRSLVIWECEVRDETEVEARLREFLGPRIRR